MRLGGMVDPSFGSGVLFTFARRLHWKEYPSTVTWRAAIFRQMKGFKKDPMILSIRVQFITSDSMKSRSLWMLMMISLAEEEVVSMRCNPSMIRAPEDFKLLNPSCSARRPSSVTKMRGTLLNIRDPEPCNSLIWSTNNHHKSRKLSIPIKFHLRKLSRM